MIKKYLLLMLSLSALLLLTSCGTVVGYDSGQVTPPPISRGNSIGNLALDGTIAEDGENIYIAHKAHAGDIAMTEDGLYRINRELGPMRIDKLFSVKNPRFLNIYQRWLYFVDDGLYCYDLQDNDMWQLSEEPGNKLVIYESSAFYETQRGISRFNLDSAKEELFLPDARLIDILDNRLYFLQENNLSVLNLKSGESKTLYSNFPETYQLVLTSSGIYFAAERLYYFDFSSGAIHHLTERSVYYFYVDEEAECLWFTEPSGAHSGSGLLVKANLDGSGRQELNVNCLAIFKAGGEYYVRYFLGGYYAWCFWNESVADNMGLSELPFKGLEHLITELYPPRR